LFVPVAPSGTGVGSRVSFASTQNGCGRCEVSAETAGAGTAAEPGPGLHRRAPAVRRADGTCGGAVVTNEAVQRAPGHELMECLRTFSHIVDHLGLGPRDQ